MINPVSIFATAVLVFTVMVIGITYTVERYEAPKSYPDAARRHANESLVILAIMVVTNLLDKGTALGIWRWDLLIAASIGGVLATILDFFLLHHRQRREIQSAPSPLRAMIELAPISMHRPMRRLRGL